MHVSFILTESGNLHIQTWYIISLWFSYAFFMFECSRVCLFCLNNILLEWTMFVDECNFPFYSREVFGDHSSTLLFIFMLCKRSHIYTSLWRFLWSKVSCTTFSFMSGLADHNWKEIYRVEMIICVNLGLYWKENACLLFFHSSVSSAWFDLSKFKWNKTVNSALHYCKHKWVCQLSS